MKFGYTVKHNGVWYLPGQEVPEEKPNETVVEDNQEKKLNKSDITLMKVSDLRELAAKHGVETENVKTDELRKTLIEKLNL